VKKLVFLMLIGLISVTVMGAAPAYNEWASYLGDTLTVDSQHTASVWEVLDTIIIIKTDTCYTVYTMSGIAALNPGGALYLGFDDGGGISGAPVDTFIVQNTSPSYTGQVRIPFSVRYVDSLISQTDANDTIYFYAAKKGSGTAEKVVIEKGLITVDVLDHNIAGMIGE